MKDRSRSILRQEKELRRGHVRLGHKEFGKPEKGTDQATEEMAN